MDRPPSHASLSRSLNLALSAMPGKVILWSGEYHSRLFDSLEHYLFGAFSYAGELTSVEDLADSVQVDMVVKRALTRKLSWAPHMIKAVVVGKVLHIAVRSHLSYETAASLRLTRVFPQILWQFVTSPNMKRPKQEKTDTDGMTGTGNLKTATKEGSLTQTITEETPEDPASVEPSSAEPWWSSSRLSGPQGGAALKPAAAVAAPQPANSNVADSAEAVTAFSGTGRTLGGTDPAAAKVPLSAEEIRQLRLAKFRPV